jgi:hypothetical protein
MRWVRFDDPDADRWLRVCDPLEAAYLRRGAAIGAPASERRNSLLIQRKALAS